MSGDAEIQEEKSSGFLSSEEDVAVFELTATWAGSRQFYAQRPDSPAVRKR